MRGFDKIGIIGPNGIGKTTLIKTLIGTLPPFSGQVIRHKTLKIGYFDQNLAGLNETLTVPVDGPRPLSDEDRRRGPRPARALPVRRRRRLQNGRRPVRRREGPARAVAFDARGAGDADPRRTDEPSRHRDEEHRRGRVRRLRRTDPVHLPRPLLHQQGRDQDRLAEGRRTGRLRRRLRRLQGLRWPRVRRRRRSSRRVRRR
ncbi:MAG: ATP-binding cassette domain-containing protein [Bacillus subtilis]|nr:ATP-binding cassette domain-containing protein [Bacillus subtilis]